jgi:hypothetical protein
VWVSVSVRVSMLNIDMCHTTTHIDVTFFLPSRCAMCNVRTCTRKLVLPEISVFSGVVWCVCVCDIPNINRDIKHVEGCFVFGGPRQRERGATGMIQVKKYTAHTASHTRAPPVAQLSRVSRRHSARLRLAPLVVATRLGNIYSGQKT